MWKGHNPRSSLLPSATSLSGEATRNCSRMGVQSLTTYVKKNNLGSYVYLPDPLGERGLPLIVDGMAWAYNVGLVDTFQGGSYAAIRANTRRYVEYWRACGLEPEVVWDGASTPFFP